MNPQEVQQLAQNSINGNWIPFGIVCALLGIIVVMIVKTNDKKHNETSEMMKEIVKNNNYLSKMVAVHDSELNHLKEKA
jgi:cadmium resistance protein CadD (predicted permease)